MEEKKEAGSSPAKKTTVRSFICMFLFCLDWPILFRLHGQLQCWLIFDFYLPQVFHFVSCFCSVVLRSLRKKMETSRLLTSGTTNTWALTFEPLVMCKKTNKKNTSFHSLLHLLQCSARVFYFLRAWISRLFQLIRLLQLDCRMLQNTIRLCCVCKLSPVSCVFITTTSSED